jgi:hypothetical protein
VHDPAAIGDVPLIQAEIERFEGYYVGPTTPMTDGSPEPLAVRGAVRIVQQTVKRLDGEQVELPIVRLLTEDAMPATEGIGGVTPLIITDQTPIQELEVMVAEAQGDRARVAQGVSRQQSVEAKLGVEADELQFIHVAIIQRVRAVVTMRVLELDGEAERIDEIMDAQVEPGAMQERLIDTVARASDVIVSAFVAEAVIETDIEPSDVMELFPRTRAGGTHILGRIRVALGAVTGRLPIECRTLRSRPRYAEAEQGSKQRMGGREGHL